MKNILLLLACSLVLLSACESAQQREQNEMNAVVQRAESIYRIASDKDWENVEKDFEKREANYNLDRTSYSPEQIDSMNVQIGRFRALQSKRLLMKTKEGIKDLGKQVEGYFDELSK
jgi:hypothetical protein